MGAGGGVRCGTHEGPRRLPGVREAVTLGKQSPGEANKLFGGQRGNSTGGRRGCRETERDKDPRPPCLRGSWERPGWPEGASWLYQHWADDNPPGPPQTAPQQPGLCWSDPFWAVLPSPTYPFALTLENPFISFFVIIWFTYWLRCLLECHLPQQVVPS